MKYRVVGLGNPGKEYENTRHNVGEMALRQLHRAFEATEWEEDKKLKAETAEAKLGKHAITLVFPLTLMNNSGKSVAPLVKSKKDLERLVVIHDDLDLPLRKIKISYGKNSGGHRGVESIMRAVKSKEFIRIRIGVSPETSGGKLKKPSGEKAVVDFILGKFKPTELEMLKKEFKSIAGAIEVFVEGGREKMVSTFQG